MNHTFSHSRYEEDSEEAFNEDEINEEYFNEADPKQIQQILVQNQQLRKENEYLRRSHAFEIHKLQQQLEETNKLLSDSYQLIEEKEQTIQFQLNQIRSLNHLSESNNSNSNIPRNLPYNDQKNQNYSVHQQQSPNPNHMNKSNNMPNESYYQNYKGPNPHEVEDQEHNQQRSPRRFNNNNNNNNNNLNKKSIQEWINKPERVMKTEDNFDNQNKRNSSPRKRVSPRNQTHNKSFQMDEEPVIYSPRSRSTKSVLRPIKAYDDQIHFGETDSLDREIINTKGMSKSQMIELLNVFEAEKEQLEKNCNRAYSSNHGAILQKERRERELSEDRLYIITKSIGRLKQALSK